MKKKALPVLLVLSVTLLFSSCAQMKDEGVSYGVQGAASGAAIGGLISGRGGGALFGAIAGGIVGTAMDVDERQQYARNDYYRKGNHRGY